MNEFRFFDIKLPYCRKCRQSVDNRKEYLMRELRTTDRLIITVSPTGAFQGKEANPNIPLDPEEIAQSVYESWNEGASIAHIHAREKGTHKPTTDPVILREIDERIRAKGCDIIIQHSTAHDFIPRLGEDKRIKAIEMNPEMASLSVTFTRMNTFGQRESVFITTIPEIEHGAQAMLERDVKPELEVYSPVVMEDVHGLTKKGLLKKPYWVSFVFGMHRTCQSYMPYTPGFLMLLVESLPPDSMFTVIGIAGDVRCTEGNLL